MEQIASRGAGSTYSGRIRKKSEAFSLNTIIVFICGSILLCKSRFLLLLYSIYLLYFSAFSLFLYFYYCYAFSVLVAFLLGYKSRSGFSVVFSFAVHLSCFLYYSVIKMSNSNSVKFGCACFAGYKVYFRLLKIFLSGFLIGVLFITVS